MTACPSAYMLKLICGLVRACVCVRACVGISALTRMPRLFDSRLWTLKDKAIQLPSLFPLTKSHHPVYIHLHLSISLTQSFFFSSISLIPSLSLSHLSDLLLLTNERGADDTYFHKMNDSSFESEEGRDEERKTPTHLGS